MHYATVEDLVNANFSETSLHFDETTPPESRNTVTQLNYPRSQTNQTSSGYIESVVICNDINVEDELSKVRGDESESAFKILSMSFYDKTLSNRPFKTLNHSPARFDEHNKTFVSLSKGHTPKNSKFTPNLASHLKPGVQKSAVPATRTKPKPASLSKANTKPDNKLFSIQEKTNESVLFSQLSAQKVNIGCLVNAVNQSHIKIPAPKTIKDFVKPENLLLKPQATPSPRTDPLVRDFLSIERPGTATNFKTGPNKSSYSNDKLKKPIMNHYSSEKQSKVALNISPRAVEFGTKITQEKPKFFKQEAMTKKSSSESDRKKLLKVETPVRSPSPASLLLNKTIFVNGLEAKKNMNHVNYSTLEKELQSKGMAKTPGAKGPKISDGLIQATTQPFKVELKNYKRSAPTSKQSSSDMKNQKFAPQKMNFVTQGNSEPRLNIKDPLNSSNMLQNMKSLKVKDTLNDTSMAKSKPSVPIRSMNERSDYLKSYLKSQLKAHSKEKSKDNSSSNSKKNILSLQCQTFEM